MSKFKDNKGRDWEVTIDVIQLRRVRERGKFELNKFSRLHELATDLIRLVDVLYLLCEEQAKAANVTDEDFGRSMVGDAILDGFQAMQEAYADFCPSQQRETFRALLAKERELEAMEQAVRMARIRAIDVASPSTISSATPGNSAESAEPILTGPD